MILPGAAPPRAAQDYVRRGFGTSKRRRPGRDGRESAVKCDIALEAAGAPSFQASCQSSVISALSTLETGQPALAPSATFWN